MLLPQAGAGSGAGERAVISRNAPVLQNASCSDFTRPPCTSPAGSGASLAHPAAPGAASEALGALDGDLRKKLRFKKELYSCLFWL